MKYAYRVGIRDWVVIVTVYSPEPSVGRRWVRDGTASYVFAENKKNLDYLIFLCQLFYY